MSTKIYQKYDGGQVTDSMLQEASRLFSENYGVWGEEASKVIGPFAKAGSRVKLSKERLRSQYLPEGAICSYVRVIVDGQLAGNAFACRWKYNDKSVCWVTQLVVDRNYRERGLASGLLNELKQDDDDIYGLMSSHAAACIAAAKMFGKTIDNVKLDFISRYAEPIMRASPISYVRDAKLRGSLFEPGDTSGMVSSVDTNFFVDHTEPLEALGFVREDTEWPLGDLIDGHEFILVSEVSRRARSRSRSSSGSSAPKSTA